MRSIAFLDLATETGWAVGSPDGDPVFGTHRLPSTGSDVGQFGRAFERWLRDFIAVHDPKVLAFEAPILVGGKTAVATARKLMGLAYHTEVICGDLQVIYFEANVMTLKKWFAGHGRADKADMIAVARRYGWAVGSEHEADACAGWAYAVKCKASAFAGRFSGGPLAARPLAA